MPTHVVLVLHVVLFSSWIRRWTDGRCCGALTQKTDCPVSWYETYEDTAASRESEFESERSIHLQAAHAAPTTLLSTHIGQMPNVISNINIEATLRARHSGA